VVSTSTEQCSARQTEGNKAQYSIAEAVERRDQGEETLTGERDEQVKKVRSSGAQKSRTTEVDLVV
jgi:hypothetical protein